MDVYIVDIYSIYIYIYHCISIVLQWVDTATDLLGPQLLDAEPGKSRFDRAGLNGLNG